MKNHGQMMGTRLAAIPEIRLGGLDRVIERPLCRAVVIMVAATFVLALGCEPQPNNRERFVANLPDAKRGLNKEEVQKLLGRPQTTGKRDGWETFEYGPFRWKENDLWYVMQGTVWFENGRSVRSAAFVTDTGYGKQTIIGGKGELTREALDMMAQE